MKKNLRIVSAAAAALLAVAPVAAAAVVSPATTSVAHAAGDYTNANALKKLDLGNKQEKNGVKASDLKQDLRNKILNDTKYAPKTISLRNGSTATTGQPTTLTLKKQNALATDVNIYDANGNYYGNDKLKAGIYTVRAKANYAVQENASNLTSANIGGHTLNFILKSNVYYIQPEFTETVVVGNATEASDAYLKAASTDELKQQGAYANNGTVYAGEKWSAHVSEGGSLADLRNAVEGLVKLGHDVDHGANKVFEPLTVDGSEHRAWDKYVWNTENATNAANLISQLKNQGVWDASSNTIKANGKSFTVSVRTNGGRHIDVVFQDTGYVDEDAPVIIGKYANLNPTNNADTNVYGSSDRDWEPVQDRLGYVRPLIIEQHDDGTFQPTEYFGAWNSNKEHGRINVTVKSSNVDWTKPGLYSVELTATNAAKKSADVTVPVLVTAKNGNVMTVIKNTNVYTEQNGQMVQANLVNYQALVNPGNTIEVYGSAVTKKLNGVDTQFYRIVSPTANYYVLASALKNGVVSTPSTTQEVTTTKTVMHISTIYDKNGVATHEPALRAYDSVSVVSTPVTINGAKFYKIAGKDQYIKVGNIDGTSRTLKHNAYVYKSNGKARMASKKHHVVRKSGSSITTFGKSFMINGSQMYRVGRNQYIKKANFR